MPKESGSLDVKRAFSLSGLRSEATWENGSEHSGSLGFADTEEVTGSNPVAPTAAALTRHFADMLGQIVVENSGRGRVQRSGERLIGLCQVCG